MDRRVSWVVEWLDREWRERVRVEDLAERVGIGVSRLEHLFKSEAKISIREYVRERRLREAASMLATTEERISSIGYICGWADVSNFNHAFKRCFGVSPRGYRAQAQRPNPLTAPRRRED